MNELAQKMISGMTEKNSELDFRIKENTELYRKGFGRIHLLNPDGTPCAGKADIRLKLKKHEYKFGSTLFMLDEFPEAEKNAAFREYFKEMFNLGVIPFYWKDLEPVPGAYRFDRNCPRIYRRPSTDLCVEFCEENGIAAKGHPLCWSQYLPDWLPSDRREFLRLHEKRVAKIAERYADKIFIFDAINEVLSSNRFPDTPYPDDIMDQAFRIAEKYFPHAQLVLNEDVHWWRYQGIHTHFYMLAKELISHGIRPGGLGFQYHGFHHYFTNKSYTGRCEFEYFMNAENLYRLLDLYGNLAVPCSLTEISIPANPKWLGPDAEEVQKIITERLYRLWFSHPATDGIVWWNPVDGTCAEAPLGDMEKGGNVIRAALIRFDMSLNPAGEAVRRLIREEWHTETVVAYDPDGENRFHGFYGDYDMEIRTEGGIRSGSLTLSKHAPSDLKVRLGS